ncbi:unnamed protein product, partial [Iphiclides podalirius]
MVTLGFILLTDGSRCYSPIALAGSLVGATPVATSRFGGGGADFGRSWGGQRTRAYPPHRPLKVRRRAVQRARLRPSPRAKSAIHLLEDAFGTRGRNIQAQAFLWARCFDEILSKRKRCDEERNEKLGLL